jgi:hypothetical protein
MVIKGHPSFLGPTGKHPEGKLTDDDEGELVFAVDAFKDKVRVTFNTEVSWLAIAPAQARILAGIIADVADEAERGS